MDPYQPLRGMIAYDKLKSFARSSSYYMEHSYLEKNAPGGSMNNIIPGGQEYRYGFPSIKRTRSREVDKSIGMVGREVLGSLPLLGYFPDPGMCSNVFPLINRLCSFLNNVFSPIPICVFSQLIIKSE